jgi:hypothetical protein
VSPDKSFDNLPDVRDGLTRKERIVLYLIDQIQKERGGRNVPTAMLYGRVLEHVDMSVEELQAILQRFTTENSRKPDPWE